jgi:Domain of unknown function (DUF397)
MPFMEDFMLSSESEPTEPKWRKATYSTGNGACVEVASLGGILAIRDSQDKGGPIMVCGRPAWQSFVSAIRATEWKAHGR